MQAAGWSACWAKFLLCHSFSVFSVASVLTAVKSIRNFNLHDEVRATAPHAIQRLYSVSIPCHQMVYPCLKRAYLRGSSLCHLQIVDQVINFRDFRDLLELKYLSSLYIDWHDDAVNSPSWFPDMLAKEASWVMTNSGATL